MATVTETTFSEQKDVVPELLETASRCDAFVFDPAAPLGEGSAGTVFPLTKTLVAKQLPLPDMFKWEGKAPPGSTLTLCVLRKLRLFYDENATLDRWCENLRNSSVKEVWTCVFSKIEEFKGKSGPDVHVAVNLRPEAVKTGMREIPFLADFKNVNNEELVYTHYSPVATTTVDQSGYFTLSVLVPPPFPLHTAILENSLELASSLRAPVEFRFNSDFSYNEMPFVQKRTPPLTLFNASSTNVIFPGASIQLRETQLFNVLQHYPKPYDRIVKTLNLNALWDKQLFLERGKFWVNKILHPERFLVENCLQKGEYVCTIDAYAEYLISLLCGTLYKKGTSINFVSVTNFSTCINVTSTQSEVEIKGNQFIIMDRVLGKCLYSSEAVTLFTGWGKEGFDHKIENLIRKAQEEAYEGKGPESPDLYFVEPVPEYFFKALVVQTLFAIAPYQEAFRISHNDLNLYNIMITQVTSQSKWKTKRLSSYSHFGFRLPTGTVVEVPFVPFVVKIIDFGKAVKYSTPKVRTISLESNANYSPGKDVAQLLYDLGMWLGAFDRTVQRTLNIVLGGDKVEESTSTEALYIRNFRNNAKEFPLSAVEVIERGMERAIFDGASGSSETLLYLTDLQKISNDSVYEEKSSAGSSLDLWFL